MLMKFGVRTDEFKFGSVFEWFGQDSGRIIIIDNHDVLISLAGRDGEMPCLVRVNLAGDVDEFREDKMSLYGRL